METLAAHALEKLLENAIENAYEGACGQFESARYTLMKR